MNGSSDTSPLWVRAHNIGCNGLKPTAFGYSIDSSPTTKMGVTPYDIDVTGVGIGAGGHTIHFKSWTANGICPVVNTSFSVRGGSTSTPTASSSTATPASTTSTSIPSYAKSSGDLDGFGNWSYSYDSGTSGSAKGSMVYPATTPVYDPAREFYMYYTNHGGGRWHLTFANDAYATHFIYDTYVFVKNPSQVQNLEMDMNQVMPGGKTVIYGMQCSSVSNTWEYAYVSSGHPHWHASNLGCNPRGWSANSWHHIQIASHRDSYGNVTYDWVTLDGSQRWFSGAHGYSALPLGWATGTLLLNFQMDGYYGSSGSITMYIHKMTIYRW